MREENSRPTTDDQKTEQYIYRKIAESAEAYREKLDADPSLAHIQVTDEMRADMMRRIAAIKAESAAQEDAALERNIAPVEKIGDAGNMSASDINLLSEEDKHALEIGRKVLHVKKRSKVWRRLGLVAILVLGVFGISMTSSANRLWILNLWKQMTGKEKVFQTVNWDDVDFPADMQKIAAEIQEKTGIHVPYLIYIPERLKFDNYVVYENLNIARLFYQYDDTIMTIDMKKELQKTSRGFIFDGDIKETIEVDNSSYGTIEVSAVSAPGEETDYVADFLYDDCQYTIYGVLPKEEFIKMIEKIQIF